MVTADHFYQDEGGGGRRSLMNLSWKEIRSFTMGAEWEVF